MLPGIKRFVLKSKKKTVYFKTFYDVVCTVVIIQRLIVSYYYYYNYPGSEVEEYKRRATVGHWVLVKDVSKQKIVVVSDAMENF
jgi:deoxycytidylate deaminase